MSEYDARRGYVLPLVYKLHREALVVHVICVCHGLVSTVSLLVQ